MKRFVRWGAILTLAGLVSVQFLALFVYEGDQRFLRALEDQIASPGLPASQQTKLIVNYFRDKPDAENQNYLFLPILDFLRATPRQVAERGGWCSDRSRLLVALLNLRGIHAEKWALYSPKLIPRHAVVEVDTEQGKMAADPLFGMWFPKPTGGYYGVDDLRAHAEILKARIDALVARGEDPGSEPVRQYPLDDYSYARARTINWDKNVVTVTAYKLLHFAIGDRADHIPRPAWTEQPALMLAYGIIPLDLLLLVVILRYRGATQKSEERISACNPDASPEPEKKTERLTQLEEYSVTRHDVR